VPIAKAAVEAYLARQIETRAWFKDLKPLEVEYELTFVNPPHRFRIPMRTDQKICFMLGLAYPETLFMADLGLGKTGVSLELMQYFYDHEFVRRGIMFAPTDELVEGWEDEIKKWGFDLPYTILAGSSRNKWQTLDEFGDGLVMGTYAGIAAMVSKMVPRKKDGVDTGRKKRQPVNDLYDRILDRVDAVIYDQSTLAGNRGSLNFKVCNRFSAQAQIRLALAGRAFGRDPAPLWSQFMLVDRGRAFGETLGMFREAFYRREVHNWGTKWVLRKRRQKQLAHFTSASSIRYSSAECVELPPVTKIVKECEFPDENWRYFERVREELLAQRGNWREIKNAFLKMRQISSGFVGFVDDDTGERAQIEFEANPKLNLSLDLLDKVPEDCKVIVFHEYTWSGARICQELAKRKYKHGWLWAGTNNWSAIKEQFNNDPEYRFLVANWRKGSMGLNLQAANYTLFYESPVSPISRSECEGRTNRTGQTKRGFVYDPVVKNSVDELILGFHKEGNDLFKALVDRPEKLLKGGRRRA
jgi:hypothetical protein